MPTTAIVDANVLYAVADARDPEHSRALATLERGELDLVLPMFAVVEAAQLIEARRGPRNEASFLRGLRAFRIEAPGGDDWLRMAELIERYADFPLGSADASIVALAERLGTDTILTFDRRHFSVVRPRHCPSFRLLPD